MAERNKPIKAFNEEDLVRTVTPQEFQKATWIIGHLATQGVITGIGGVGFVACDNLWGSTAQQRQRDWDRRLETGNTLGTEPTSPSFNGWVVRYARNEDGNFIPTNVLSDPLEPGTWIQFPSNKLNRLENIGVILRDHIRTTDEQPVGKLAIVTKYTPPDSRSSSPTYQVGEEWVLRGHSARESNSNILIFENQATGLRHYLSITRSKAIESQQPVFQLRAYQLQTR